MMSRLDPKKWLRQLLALWLLTSSGGLVANAAPLLTSDQLLKLVEPVAYYDDSVLAVILPSAVYPIEILEAGQFAGDQEDLAGLDEQTWAPSIKSLTRMSPVLDLMDTHIEWTTDLGEAFLGQPRDVLVAVQRLRIQAFIESKLTNTPIHTISTARTRAGNQIVRIKQRSGEAVSAVWVAPPQPISVPESELPQAIPPGAQNQNVVIERAVPPASTETASTSNSTDPVDPSEPASTSEANSNGPDGTALKVAAGVALGVAVINNVDWENLYVVQTPRGVVVGQRPDDPVARPTGTTSSTAQNLRWEPDQDRLQSAGATARTDRARGRARR